MQTWDYVLPTGTSINPATREGEYADERQTLLVMFKLNDTRTRPTRVISSFGDCGIELGTVAECFHDQTRARLGTYEVVGISHPDGRFEGEIPNRKIKHSVFK